MNRMISVEDRFWEKVNKSEGCWLWTASCSHLGYGQFRLDGAMRPAHRVAYSLSVGEIPGGFHILHSCDNPPCVNPAHLRAGTHTENMREMSERGRNSKYQANKTHCPAGHPYDEKNTYVTARGSRNCRPCAARVLREYRARQKEAN